MTRAYKLKNNSSAGFAAAGTVVYGATGSDYGLADDDTRASGVEHISVSLKRSGGYPTFTHPLRDLEAIEVERLPPLDDKHVKEVCQIGAGAEACRYLTVGARGFSCEKHSSLAGTIDEKTDMIARGDNCEGRS